MGFRVFHYYLLPLACAATWWTMLVALMAAWCIQGKPKYSWQSSYQNPIYISGIGATNLQPVFIVGAAVQGIFFAATVVMEFLLRKRGQLQLYTFPAQRGLSIACIVLGCLGQVCIVLVSCFKTTVFETFHLSMVGGFVGFVFLSCVLNLTVTGYFAFYPERLSTASGSVCRWSNVYMIAFWMKLTWLIVAMVFVVLFFLYMATDEKSLSSIFEWAISFWYGFLMLLWAADLFQAAKKQSQDAESESFEKAS